MPPRWRCAAAAATVLTIAAAAATCRPAAAGPAAAGWRAAVSSAFGPAAVSAAAASAAAVPAAADTHGQPGQARHLGRLFSTPQERALLDARRDGTVIDGEPAAPPAPPLPPSPPAPLQLNGVVQRSNGQSTVWLNDAPLSERDGKVLPDRAVLLRLPSGKRVTLKPGQSYDEATGTISNAGE
ncbi:hypothetical protein ASC94_00310 [Massilia sp. Root418]|nr:hypothetical protein ASC94_00310 [Massilia sp. Root418]